MHTRLAASLRGGALALMVLFGGVACDAGTSGPGTSASPATNAPATPPDPSADPGDGSSPTGGDMIPPALLDQVVRDAATRAGVDPSAVVVVTGRAVTWPNGAAGCPQPGMAYTDALVPGYWVVVEAGGAVLDYRGAQAGPLQLCPNPGPAPEASGAI